MNDKLSLFLKQKETLDTFLRCHAITKDQYDISCNGLKEKMGITDEEINRALPRDEERENK